MDAAPHVRRSEQGAFRAVLARESGARGSSDRPKTDDTAPGAGARSEAVRDGVRRDAGAGLVSRDRAARNPQCEPVRRQSRQTLAICTLS